jgi:hypothetical protein
LAIGTTTTPRRSRISRLRTDADGVCWTDDNVTSGSQLAGDAVADGGVDIENMSPQRRDTPLVMSWIVCREQRRRRSRLSVDLLPDCADPKAFIERYRERTGMTEEQLNPEIVEYFHVLGLARLFGQEMAGADAVANGEFRGIMASYLISAVSNTSEVYFNIARRVGTR